MRIWFYIVALFMVCKYRHPTISIFFFCSLLYIHFFSNVNRINAYNSLIKIVLRECSAIYHNAKKFFSNTIYLKRKKNWYKNKFPNENFESERKKIVFRQIKFVHKMSVYDLVEKNRSWQINRKTNVENTKWILRQKMDWFQIQWTTESNKK